MTIRRILRSRFSLLRTYLDNHPRSRPDRYGEREAERRGVSGAKRKTPLNEIFAEEKTEKW